MTMPYLTDSEIDTVEQLARDAGGIALDYFERLSSLAVSMKGDHDLFTEADRSVESFIVARLQAAFPDDGILGEEGSFQPGARGRLWIIDPIDGTANFVRGNDQWAVSIGLFAGGSHRYGVIHAPARRQMFCGGDQRVASVNGRRLAGAGQLDPARALIGISLHPAIAVETRIAAIRRIIGALHLDFRTCGASTITLMEMAMGYIDGFYCDGIASWDVMAAMAILESIGFASNIAWDENAMMNKLCFACGPTDFVKAMTGPLQ